MNAIVLSLLMYHNIIWTTKLSTWNLGIPYKTEDIVCKTRLPVIGMKCTNAWTMDWDTLAFTKTSSLRMERKRKSILPLYTISRGKWENGNLSPLQLSLENLFKCSLPSALHRAVTCPTTARALSTLTLGLVTVQVISPAPIHHSIISMQGW